MKLSLPRRVVLPLRIACIASLFVGAAACDHNQSSPSSTGGCQVITGNATTSFPASGGSSTVSIRTPSTCTWGAASNASFLTVTSGASGAGDGTIAFSVAENTGPQRTAALTVTDSNPAYADTIITITQSGR